MAENLSPEKCQHCLGQNDTQVQGKHSIMPAGWRESQENTSTRLSDPSGTRSVVLRVGCSTSLYRSSATAPARERSCLCSRITAHPPRCRGSRFSQAGKPGCHVWPQQSGRKPCQLPRPPSRAFPQPPDECGPGLPVTRTPAYPPRVSQAPGSPLPVLSTHHLQWIVP